MIGIELSSLPGAIPVENIPPNPGYFRRFKQGATSLFGEMGHHILSYLYENAPASASSPVIVSPWERLMDYSPMSCYYTAVSTAEGLLSRKDLFSSNLSESVHHLSRYWPTQVLIYEYYSRIYIHLRDTLPPFFVSAPATVGLTSHHPCPAVTQVPSIPTIVVTDVDGSRAGCYNALHEVQIIIRAENGLLWREWTGKFSPTHVSEDVFFDGAPPISEEQEDGSRAEVKCSQRGTNDRLERLCEEDKGSSRGNAIVDENSARNNDQGNALKELEWWEKEDDSEDQYEGNDSDFGEEDSEEEESEEEDSEDDGDDEYEDDSDDGSDVDSDMEEDLDETSAETTCSIASRRVSATQTTVSLLCKASVQHPISVQERASVPGSFQLPQSLEEANGLGVSIFSSSPSSSCFSLGDSDLESSNSSRTISSIPTPITPASPSITPIDSSDPQKRQQGGCNELPETSWLLMNSLDAALGAARRAGTEMEFQVSLPQGQKPECL